MIGSKNLLPALAVTFYLAPELQSMKFLNNNLDFLDHRTF